MYEPVHFDNMVACDAKVCNCVNVWHMCEWTLVSSYAYYFSCCKTSCTSKISLSRQTIAHTLSRRHYSLTCMQSIISPWHYSVVWLCSIIYLACDMGLHYLTFMIRNLENKKKLTRVQKWVVMVWIVWILWIMSVFWVKVLLQIVLSMYNTKRNNVSCE